ncbi:hypothetical protein KC19_11G063100 [Ceratodon purpureus]|uniref:Uncharacterized protein n=1 Tax=Ceratodon purpureus TaxID=3225 RepID=A0A8T0GB29_CERPU|nr:hypothetical protein KC19_11G063100 [Ceratodon purpureus]
MSFAGGSGHKSPFAERSKATKSNLSPRRSSAASGSGSVRSSQQSLFGKEATFGGKDSQFGDSTAKVSHLRNGAQPDVKEPTTPTKASEGGMAKGNRRDEFSSFNNRRVGTPVKTPRTAFGTIPPRSPKRPYMGSPKYQKVLMERPAFYNSPAAAEPSAESGKKEVSISELQKRLKRFLQDENVPSRSQLEVAPFNLDEVPYNISRSPRVNPLFHHDDTVLQIAKGGVAFTAGADFADENTCAHSSADSFKENHEHSTGFHFAKGGVAFTAGDSDSTCAHTLSLSNEEEVNADMGVALLRTPSPEPALLAPQSLSEDEPDSNDVSDSNNVSNETEASETERALCPEDFPVHSEGEDGCQVEEVCEEIAVPGLSDLEETPAQLEQQSISTITSGIVEVQECPIEEATLLPKSSDDEIVEEKAQEVAHVAVKSITAGVALENQVDATADCTSEEEVEEYEILESWSQRFLKFVVLAVMVACMMGFMVLASGSQGLLPKSLHSTTVGGPFSGSYITPSVIPISVGFIGLGREHEGMPCLPSVHLGLEFLSSTSELVAAQQGSSTPGFTSGSYETIGVSREHVIENAMDLDELKSATDYYKELQGRLFSDVASLTSETALPDSSFPGITMDGKPSASVENVQETAAFEDSAEDVASEDVSEVTAPEEVVPFEDVAESSAMVDIPEVVDEVAEVQTSETLSYLEDFGREEPEESLTAQIPESHEVSLGAATGPENDEVPADMELDVSNFERDAVPTSEFVASETTGIPSSDSLVDSQPAEIEPSVVESSIEEPATTDVPPTTDEVVDLLNVPSVTEEIATDEYTIVSPVQVTVEDLVDGHDEKHVNVHLEKPESQSTTEAAISNEEDVQPLSEATCHTPVSEVVVSEEPILEKPVAEGSLPVTTIGLLVVALALAAALVVNMRKSPTVSQAAKTATDVKLFPGTADTLKNMGSPVAFPSTRSVYDSHVPDRDELDAISSPLKGIRTSRKYGMESYSSKYGLAEPAMSAPGVFKSPARVVQKPATTWHPAMKDGGSTISSSYRQTASYIPSIPSESGISTSTRGASEMDSVCESALTMGAEEWEHLGSFTTTDVVTVVNDGGEEQKVRTPVRRSQRIRNRVSPLPVRFNDFL